MSIVNPGGLPRYEDIEPTTRKLAEEVILNKSDDGNFAKTISSVLVILVPGIVGLLMFIMVYSRRYIKLHHETHQETQ